ncbi:unnamed protein product [Ilex paraguariensis]|uniref:TFIIF beta subunit N-terminal domain-containing protein n=1 Tax=Ilex paraguariensis TaxID=185542 RepID=A0ABC8RTB5_9AQUA
MEGDQSNGSNSDSTNLDTAKAERSVWLMKCPVVVSKSWQSHTSSSDSQPVAKVVVSLDPLRSEDPSSLQTLRIICLSYLTSFLNGNQFTMETAGNGVGNMPKTYSLNMFKDFVPMCVFGETHHGNVYFRFSSFIL